MHSRPMTTQNQELKDGKLWFFMSRRSGPVGDVEADPIVNVSYSDPDADTYVSVSGTAQVVSDVARARELWNTAAEAWFPGGPEDPDLALVAVHIEHAHYWDVKENQLTQLLAFVRQAVGRRMSGALPELQAQIAGAVLVAHGIKGYQALYLGEEQFERAFCIQRGLQL